ncbi:MAG: kelch repeat-containing protein [Candidatus Sericytochromatia bacterium]|nr:kelch repeat-containing protein [Candidatus Sericytochromatia bacterium]
MQARLIAHLGCAILFFSNGACTQLKSGSVASASAVPLNPAASIDPDATPVPFPSEAPPAATPAPTPTPEPRITLLEPASTTDFSRNSISFAFTADTVDSRPIVRARILFDGRELALLDGPGPLFRLENWNPNVENSLSDPPLLTQVPSGDHTIIIEATDTEKRTGRVEVKFFKPIKLVEWQEMASMPLPTSHHQMMPDNAEPPAFVSLWGSVDGVENPILPRNQAFSFVPGERSTWSTIALTGTGIPRAGYAVAPHPGGQFQYIVGGRRENSDTGVVDLHSPLRKVAERLETVGLIAPRTDACAAVVNEHLYVFGGRQGGQTLNSTERIELKREDGLPVGTFVERAASLNARAGAYSYVQGNEVWLIGGGHRPIEVYDTVKDTWRLLTDSSGRSIGTPETWSFAATVEVAGRIFFFGGIRDDGTPTERIYEFNPGQKLWRDLGALPVVEGEPVGRRPISRMAAIYHGGYFYLAGGLTYPDRRSSDRVFRVKTL